MLVPADSPLKTAHDVNGKIVATASLLALGTVAMDAWMDRNGGDSKTVRFLELPWSAAGAALRQGRVDAAIVDNPAYAQALADGGVRTLTRVYTAIAKQFLLGAWFVTGDYLAKNRAIAARFARVWADAAAFTRTHPDQTIDDVAQLTKQDRNVIAHMQRTWVGTTVSSQRHPAGDRRSGPLSPDRAHLPGCRDRQRRGGALNRLHVDGDGDLVFAAAGEDAGESARRRRSRGPTRP